jgi:pimeloyl-ACP methyl ester carboxylesterase
MDTPPGSSSQTIDVGGLDVHYLQSGTGPPVILLHGFPETSHQWRHQIPALAAAGHAVFAPDNRGFGATGKPDVRISRELLARDVTHLMDRLGIERAAVVGHDWGGIIAAKLAFDHPGRVSRLALLDTISTVWPPAALHGWWFKSEGRAEAFFADLHVAFLEVVLGGRDGGALPGHPLSPWSLAPGRERAPVVDADSLDHYLAAFRDPATHAAAIQYYRYGLPFHRLDDDGGPHVLSESEVAALWEDPDFVARQREARWCPVFGPEDSARTYAGPTLWMYGAGSPVGDPRHVPSGNPFVDQFARHYPDLQVLGVACGHFIPEEAPEVTNETLAAFLRADR